FSIKATDLCFPPVHPILILIKYLPSAWDFSIVYRTKSTNFCQNSLTSGCANKYAATASSVPSNNLSSGIKYGLGNERISYTKLLSIGMPYLKPKDIKLTIMRCVPPGANEDRTKLRN